MISSFYVTRAASMYACEVHAMRCIPYEVQAYEVQAYEPHAYEVHAQEVHIRS